MRPLARWNPARDVWETETTGLFCEHSDVFSATWPASGMTRAGVAYELPTSERRTDGSASSSLLQTPSVADALGGHLTRGGQRSDELLLPGQVQALLTTPVADHSRGLPQPGTAYQSLPNIVMDLLPTPRAREMEESPESFTTRQARLADNGRTKGDSGMPLSVAVQLLPTPRAQNGDDRNQSIWARDLSQPQNLENALARLPGASTNPRFDGGNKC